MAGNIAKRGSGQFDLTREIGGKPNSTSGTAPGPGTDKSGPGDSNMAAKHSGRFDVDRTVKCPPTKSPAK